MTKIVFGGLSMSVIASAGIYKSPFPSQIESITHFFFHFTRNEKEIASDSKNSICVQFALLQESDMWSIDIDEEYFSDQRIILYKKKTGNLKLRCLAENGKDVLWNLSFDPEFSHFEYSLSPEAIKTSDLFQLTFNRFLFQHTYINHNGLIIHAAGGSISGKGMVFPAVSGTGKSTLSHLLLPYPENQLFSEERLIMRQVNDSWRLWGTPWHGTGVIARNESAPLSALVFLSQAPVTKISELSPSAALRRLLETVSIPWYSQEWTDKGLAVCESLLRDIPAFELAFRPDQTAVQAVADLAASLD